MNVPPTPGSRCGWSYKVFRRIGLATVLKPNHNGDHDRYGIYGIRGDGAEMFLQYEGFVTPDGSMITGITLLSSSCDLGAYFWCPTDGLTPHIFTQGDRP